MDIYKMLQTQKALDDRIRKEKGLEDQDLTQQTFLALLVELGEMSNEWAKFKFWKENPQPKSGLLEEYVDALHFFLSLGLQILDIEEAAEEMDTVCRMEEQRELFVEIGTTEYLINIFRSLCYAYPFEVLTFNRFKVFISAWQKFLVLGTDGFGFDYPEIEAAYYEKNKINHERQANGY